MGGCACRTRRSTPRCLCRPQPCCVPSCLHICEPDASVVVRSDEPSHGRSRGESLTWCRSISDPTAYWTEPCQAIGRVILWSVATDAALWSRWWSGTAATCWFSRYSTPRPGPWSPPSWQRSSSYRQPCADPSPGTGVEMTRHADFTAATGIPVYFCGAYCPWQRGSNENSNGLLRQYFLNEDRPIPARR
jgi:hypothetical protein